MLNSAVAPTIAALRVRIQRLEGATAQKCEALSFAIAEIGGKLPGGGLVIGALHEVAGGGADAVHGAAAALFVAGIVARTKGDIIWCLTRPDLFAPALAQAGLHHGSDLSSARLQVGGHHFEQGPALIGTTAKHIHEALAHFLPL